MHETKSKMYAWNYVVPGPGITLTLATPLSSCSNKNACKSIFLGVQLRHSRRIDNYAD